MKASIFGSVSRMGDYAESDLDLLLEYRKGVTLLDVAALKNELEKAIGRSVDLVSPRYLNPLIKDRVLKEQIRM